MRERGREGGSEEGVRRERGRGREREGRERGRRRWCVMCKTLFTCHIIRPHLLVLLLELVRSLNRFRKIPSILRDDASCPQC